MPAHILVTTATKCLITLTGENNNLNILIIATDVHGIYHFLNRKWSESIAITRPVDCNFSDALEKINGFDEVRFFSSAEDADIVERICAIGKLVSSDVLAIHAHKHPPDAKFKGVLRKHVQQGEGSGALFRKYWYSANFIRRAWPIIGVNGLKLVLLIGLFIPPITLYAAAGMLGLSILYARHAMLTRDWRVVLIPFAVSLMFACFAVAMVWAFIRGRQSFDYIKAK